MFNITKEGVISLSRGDSVTFALFINSGSEFIPVKYELTENDTVYLGICLPEQLFENAILKKTFNPDNRQFNEEGNLIINLFPEDTEFLSPGLYYYTIKLCTINSENNKEEVQTLIKKTKFFIED